jgi:hypothetical protein
MRPYDYGARSGQVMLHAFHYHDSGAADTLFPSAI